jgi:hypothetical protein
MKITNDDVVLHAIEILKTPLSIRGYKQTPELVDEFGCRFYGEAECISVNGEIWGHWTDMGDLKLLNIVKPTTNEK